MARLRIGDLPEAAAPSMSYDIPVEMGGITERISAGLLLFLLSGNAPEDLDTLEKIADSLGGDPNLSATITAALGQKAALSQVVRHDAAQSLTPTQKKQACSNIGALVSSVAAKSADYTVVAADAGALISVDASAANRTIALPSLASVGDGFPVEIKKSDTSGNTVTITGTVDGVTNKVLRLPQQSVVLVSDNTAGTWRIMAEAGTVITGSNANGSWARHADGRQECWAEVSLTPVANVLSTAAFTFAMVFATNPIVTSNPYSTVFGSTLTMNDVATISTTGATQYVMRTNTSVTPLHYVAKGRWF